MQFSSFLFQTLIAEFPHILQNDNTHDTRVIENAISLAESLYINQELYVECPQTIAIVHGIVNLIRMHDGLALRERSAQYEEFAQQTIQTPIITHDKPHSALAYATMLVWQTSIDALRRENQPLHSVDVVSCIGAVSSKIEFKMDNPNEFVCKYSTGEEPTEREIVQHALHPLLECITAETQRVYFCAKVYCNEFSVSVYYTYSCVQSRPKMRVVATIENVGNENSEIVSQ